MTSKQHVKSYALSDLVQGLEVKIQGDSAIEISGVSTIQQAEAGQISFLMNPLYRKFLTTTKASAVVLTAADAEEYSGTAIICRDPYYVYAKIASHFEIATRMQPGIHPTAVISPDCEIDPTAAIGPLVVIEAGVRIAKGVQIAAGCIIGQGVTIGADCVLDARVTVYYHCVLGERVRLYSGAVIGADGFGIAKHQGSWHKVPQLGRVILEDDVDVGANTTIDRGAIDDTVIERGVKLDNQIQVGHNVRIGAHTAIAGCVAIAGSTTIGKNCMIGGGSCIAGHISIGDNVVLYGMTGVPSSIREAGIYASGIGGVMTNTEWRKNSARFFRLEQLLTRVKELELALQTITEREK